MNDNKKIAIIFFDLNGAGKITLAQLLKHILAKRVWKS